MKMKNKIILIILIPVLVLITFVFIVHVNFIKNHNDILKFLYDQNEKNYTALNICLNSLNEGDSSLHQEQQECENIFNIITFMRDLRSSSFVDIRNTKLESKIQFISDSLGDTSSIRNVLKTLNNFHINNRQKELKLILIENYLMNKYFLNLQRRKLFFVSYGEVINISKSDTIEYGKTYNSELKFVINDITKNSYFTTLEKNPNNSNDFELKDTIFGGKYEAVTTKKGLNEIKGLFHYHSLYGVYYYKFYINYYVK